MHNWVTFLKYFRSVSKFFYFLRTTFYYRKKETSVKGRKCREEGGREGGATGVFIIIDEERATQPHSESVMKFGGKKGSSSLVRSNRVGENSMILKI